MRRALIAALGCVGALSFLSTNSRAQTLRPRTGLGIAAGFSQFDVRGTGTSALIALRGEAEARAWLVLDGGVTLFRPQTQFEDGRTYVMPELQIQAQVSGRSVRPYVGVGIGTLLARRGPNPTRVVSGAGGLRIPVRNSRVDLRTEIRVRGIGESFHDGSIIEWTIGGSYRFSPTQTESPARSNPRCC